MVLGLTINILRFIAIKGSSVITSTWSWIWIMSLIISWSKILIAGNYFCPKKINLIWVVEKNKNKNNYLFHVIECYILELYFKSNFIKKKGIILIFKKKIVPPIMIKKKFLI